MSTTPQVIACQLPGKPGIEQFGSVALILLVPINFGHESLGARLNPDNASAYIRILLLRHPTFTLAWITRASRRAWAKSLTGGRAARRQLKNPIQREQKSKRRKFLNSSHHRQKLTSCDGKVSFFFSNYCETNATLASWRTLRSNSAPSHRRRTILTQFD